MFIFQKIWRALFSCNTPFEIRLLPDSRQLALTSTVTIDQKTHESVALSGAIHKFEPSGIYLFKVKNENTRTRCKISVQS